MDHLIRISLLKLERRLRPLVWIIVLGTHVHTRADALDQWQARSLSAPGADLHGVAYGNGGWVAVGSGGAVLTSNDGSQWVAQNAQIENDLHAIAYGNGVFVASAFAYTYGIIPNFDAIFTSSDGVHWTAPSLGWTYYYLSGVAYGGGTFVTTGMIGQMLTSSDGYVWGSEKATSENLRGVGYGGGTFVAVGDHVTILASNDATNWDALSEGTASAGFNGAAYGNKLWTVVGDYGISWFYDSTTGSNWVSSLPTSQQTLHAVTYGNGSFVAVGDGGTIVTSSDGITWTPRTSGSTNDLLAVAYGNSAFVAVGTKGTILVSGAGVAGSSNGGLEVTISPPAAVEAGAQWQVDGGVWQNSEANVSGLPAGAHAVVFKALNGWTTPASQTVTITANQTATLTGTYVPVVSATRIIDLSGDLAFGEVAAGSMAQDPLTITNSGSETLTVTGIHYPNGFSGAWSGAIPPGGSQNVTVTFAPLAATNYSGTVSVDSDATAGLSTLSISGSGVVSGGRAGPALTIAPPGRGLRMTLLGAPFQTYEILASTDLKDWSLLATLADTNASGWLDFSDPAAVNFTRRFYRAQLSGTGPNPPTRILTLSSNLDFGAVTVGATAQSKFTVSNPGNATLTVSAVSYPAGFSGDWASGSIPPGGSQNVTVSFTPTAAASYGGNITVASDATAGANSLAVSGIGLAAPPATPAWQVQQIPGVGDWQAIAYGNGGLVGVTSANAVYNSADGTNWTVNDSFSGFFLPAFSGVRFVDDRFLLAGSAGLSGGSLFVSLDGRQWIQRSLTGYALDTVYGKGLFVAVGKQDTVMVSTDSTNWTGGNLSGSFLENLRGVTFGNDRFVAVGDGESGSQIVYSSDGTNWVDVSPLSKPLHGVAFGAGQFVAVGDAGAILTSSNGANWTAQASRLSVRLNAVTFAAPLFVAVGDNGSIITSADAVNWTENSSGTTENLLQVTLGSQKVYAVGTHGVVISSDGIP
jgi:HYDIN/CFA65/VesB-like, Ig-like domain